ncbi:Glutamine--fructose-6-phosphate aminotransferase isomerizing [Hondaea fermentalgiana]|uniref:Glutamine--fructose-6-phosphate aminotransferase [isomerizing] n=1 Tax=Hondaea fermentalgiana TaxID=2315210 RepID=A0A2R5GM23_9STRA|nr:Glutamine--fructose-6-phosphate aminotransferase isomerizing [Hondaea fermentalgiana]|eukprot:GBG29683.1 Glutamine--fructose-6-phosphate aminotransferase isomerizing [Hondaea fermentalgiana]
MCGIIASLMAGDQTVAVALEGLRRMEYRGYDSAGVACIPNLERTLEVEKKKGKVINLSSAVAGRPSFKDASVAVAHTRWATHGPPTDRNSHPHCSNDNKIAIVHNGIIENYQQLKEELQSVGYDFVSDTDSEILAVLIRHQQLQDPELPLEAAVSLALAECNGAWAVCVIDEANPDILVGARKGSPLILGRSRDGLMLASDATAVAGIADEVIYLEEDDVVTCTREPISGEYSYSIGSMADHHFSDYSSDSCESISSGTSSESKPSLESVTSEGMLGNRPIAARARSMKKLFRRSTSTPRVERSPVQLNMKVETIQKNGYKHFMLKEIMEQPKVLRECLRSRINEQTGFLQLPSLDNVMDRILAARRIIICACGTSWHSGLVGEYLIEGLGRIPVEVEYASEFRYRSPLLFKDDVVIVTSQSGETADTLEAIRIANKAGALTLGIVNVVGSSIARETSAVVYLQVGPEIGVASTKAFTGQVLVLTMLAVILGHRNGNITDAEALDYARQVQEIPDKVAEILTPENLASLKRLSASLRYAKNFLYLGRGFNFPVALESALKLKEVSYVHAEGYPAAEMKHGPISLIDQQMPVCVIAPKRHHEGNYEKVRSNIQEVVARSGNVIAITDEDGRADLATLAEHVMVVPSTAEWLSPLVSCIPLQLLSYWIADYRGCEIDSPRNLAKSVTVE